ncbi:hypothetical protein [uncultured Bacteroides sp.]|uniref:hypothetical protein n=1 Tax=uncultured Bacteroides sp. TaxID=162156 RepID=UPI0025E4AEDA|nr:hypothetical protein [uncultured Bacteroides sp.]
MTTDRQTRKETYTAPSLEVIKMENEGIIAASGNTESYQSTQMSKTHVNSSYSSASSSDLEDLVNDLFTVEN